MAYMNLMHRERADLRCNDPAGRAADLAEADKWVRLTLTTKKAKAEQGHHDKPAHDGDCSMYLYAPPQVPTQNKCVYSEYVEIGHAVVKTREGAANFRVSFKADFFHGLERTSTPHGFEFRKAGQPVTEYPDTLTVIIEPADFRLGASVATATLSGTRCSDSAGITTTAGDGEVAGCLPSSHSVQSGELREVVEPWPELRAPRVWYVAEIAGIKQLLATEVELVVTGKGNTPLADVRGGLVYSSAPASREPTSK